MPHFLNHDFEYALILSGDHCRWILMICLKNIKSQADISIATLPVNAKDASEFGIRRMMKIVLNHL
jgi:glucose-1-phosphate adenylyltransferase